jgi:hypothetical protein
MSRLSCTWVIWTQSTQCRTFRMMDQRGRKGTASRPRIQWS